MCQTIESIWAQRLRVISAKKSLDVLLACFFDWHLDSGTMPERSSSPLEPTGLRFSLREG
jgi:hypothetical protein